MPNLRVPGNMKAPIDEAKSTDVHRSDAVAVEELTVHRCKTHGKPKTAAPGPGGPGHWTRPTEICTSGFPLAELNGAATHRVMLTTR